ncbi:MAG: hypothetical protein NZ455_04435 [Bacteroidia bacterium]|nr:hypothetical protein [Bacteroidia bacterium]
MFFGRVPRCARVGLLRTARALRCYAHASHCLTACSVSLTHLTLDFEVLPCFYTCVCFILFDAYFQLFARLNLEWMKLNSDYSIQRINLTQSNFESTIDYSYYSRFNFVNH